MTFIRTVAKSAFSTVDLLLGDFPGPRLLIYHQIGAGHGQELDIATEVFGSQLDWLEANGQIVGLEEALRLRSLPESESSFVLTFDDGYRDMFQNAFPLLAARTIPFTLYLTTGPLEDGIPLAPDRPPLTWDDVRTMSETGLLTLGAHTHRHVDMRSAGQAQIDEELDTSNRLIEERTGSRPVHFAYPWGYWSAAADSAVRNRYASAVLGGGGSLTGDTDPFLIPRVPVQLSDGLVFFKTKMRRGLRTEEAVRRLLSGYRGP
jgi:peptidoglycan/xylan/chitin deacetylase (PgdA/CDA1 family)